MNLKEVAYKRLDKIIELIGDEEYKVEKYLLKKSHPIRLDPIEKKKLTFPTVLFPVENVPVEWWYFTGHLEAREKKGGKKRNFGFEFCIFKIHPEIFRVGPVPFYMLVKKPHLVLHSTITDKDKGKFILKQDSGLIHGDSINYGGLDLDLNNASLNFNEKSEEFQAKNEILDLKFKPLKKFIKHFDDGFVINHKTPPSRTYYVSFTRMGTRGEIKIDGKEYKVSGTSWFDHQKCNLIKKSSLIGWDWFSIMMNDKTELMFYRIRDKKGFSHRHLGGSYIDRNSKIIKLKPEEVEVEPSGNWKSDKTGIVYPSGWKIRIPRLKIDLDVSPYIKNQEVDALKSTGNSYWEGACSVEGTKKGKRIEGKSYVELVGYDKRLVYKIVKESIIG